MDATPRAPAVRAAAYTLQQLYQMPGWVVAYWNGTLHTLAPVHFFGLATVTSGAPPIIASFRYEVEARDWVCCENEATYCGLIPPGMTLADYEQHDPHTATPPAMI